MPVEGHAHPGTLHPGGERRWRRIRGSAGLTLLELVFVLAITAVLGAIAVPTYRQHLYQVQLVRCIGELRRIEQGLESYAISNDGTYPGSLAVIDLDGLRDPWGHGYRYLKISGVKSVGGVRKDKNLVPINTDYDLYSVGLDGLSSPALTAAESRDDVIRANDGAFHGLAAEY